MKLTRTERDTELWVLSSGDWTLPLLADEMEGAGIGVMLVRPAPCLHDAQRRAVDRCLAPLRQLHGSDGYLIRPDILMTVAEKAQGITPERYIRWPGETATKPPAETTEAMPPGDANQFLEYVVQHHGPAPIEIMRVVWIAICQALPSYLMSGGVVDLGSLRLGAVPMRKTWLRLLLAKALWVRQTFRDPNWRDRLAMEAERFIRTLMSGEMMSTFCRMVSGRLNTHYRWTAAVWHHGVWWDCVRELEGRHASVLGPVRYMQRWTNLVERALPFLHLLIREEVEHEGQAAGRIREGRDGVGMVLGPAAPTEVRDGDVVRGGEGGLAGPWDFWSTDSRYRYLERAIGSLQDLPDVLPEPTDLRPPGRNGEPNRDAGVLVPPADGHPATQEGLLAPRARH